MADKTSRYMFVAEELMERMNKTKADVIKNLPDGVSERSVYAYFGRKTGSIEIAAAIAEALKCTLNDIFVPAETKKWESEIPICEDTESHINESSKSDGVLDALLASDDYEAVMLAANAVSVVGLFAEGERLRTHAAELQKAKENGGDRDAK